MNKDQIRIIPSVDNESEDRLPLMIDIHINGKLIKTSSNIISFFVYFDRSEHMRDYYCNKGSVKFISEFYPFGCTCGSPGCNGIYNGVFLKNRKYSVEWRVHDSDLNSYEGVLEKRFFSFDKHEYRYQVLRCWKWLLTNINSVKTGSYYDDDISQMIEYIRSYHPESYNKLMDGMNDLKKYEKQIASIRYLNKHSRLKSWS